MTAAGNRCELTLLENQPHAFGIACYKSPEPVVVETVRRVDEFLGSLGYWGGPSTLVVSLEPAWQPIVPPNAPAARVAK
jgi:hypothetical protein